MAKAGFADFMFLHDLVTNGEKDKIEVLLGAKDFSKCAFDSMMADCNSPLNMAASRGQLELVRLFIERGMDYSHALECHPLIPAASGGHIDVVKALVEEYGMDVNQTDSSGETALFRAVGQDNLDLVKYLVESGADVNHISNSGTVLHMCMYRQGEEMCQYFLSCGFSNINGLDSTGHTVLCMANICGLSSMVDLFIENGADVNIGNQKNMTPLWFASFCNSSETVKRMYLLGADPDVESTDGIRPIYMAILHGRVETVHFLAIELNLPLNKPNTNGSPRSLISLAVKTEKVTHIILLLKAGLVVGSEEHEALSTYVQSLTPGEASSFINHALTNPPSLMDACCFCIRRTLGKTLPSLVDRLPLPKRLIAFVQLTHVVPETFPEFGAD